MRRGFRQIMDLLEDTGDLVRIKREVDPKFEMSAIMKKLEAENKAFIFENIKNADMPAVGGLFTSMSRIGLIFNENTSEEFTLDDAGQKVIAAIENPTPTTEVDTGPIKDIVLTGDQVDLRKLPVPTFFELDTGPFITAAVGIFRKPEGHLNVGFYRVLIVDRNHVLINASGLSDLRKSYDWYRENDKKMSIAMVLGAPPWLLMAAASKSPDDVSELEVAGSIVGSSLQMVRCEHSDLLVPADAEMVIETVVDLHEMVSNTMGEFGAQYGTELAPLSEVTAITKRQDAMFYTLMAGRAKEHNNLGYLTIYGLAKSIEDKIKESIPFVKQVTIHFDTRIGPLMHVVISIAKESDDQPEQVIKEAFNTNIGFFDLSWMAKRVIIVDEDVDTTNMDDVEWATWTRIGRAEKIHLFPDFVTWEIDRSALPDKTSVRIGIDATKDMDYVDDLVKPIIPGIDDIDLKDYLD